MTSMVAIKQETADVNSSQDTQQAMQQRLKKLMRLPNNQSCVDCSTPRPRWATLIVPPNAYDKAQPLPLGCFCCLECSGAHRRLGTHVTFVRSIDLDTWKEREVQALEYAGNQVVNSIFEARLDRAGKVGSSANQDERLTFIRDKYEQKLYFDNEMYLQYMKKLPSHLQSPLSILVNPNRFQNTGPAQKIHDTRHVYKSSEDSPPPRLVASNSIDDSHGESTDSSNKTSHFPGHLQEQYNYASSNPSTDLIRSPASGTMLKSSIKIATNLFTFKKRSRNVDEPAQRTREVSKSPRRVTDSPRKFMKGTKEHYDELKSNDSEPSEILTFPVPPQVQRNQGLAVFNNRTNGSELANSSTEHLLRNERSLSLDDSRNTANYKWEDDLGFEVVHCNDTRDTFIEKDILRQKTWPKSTESLTNSNFPNFEDMFDQTMLSTNSSESDFDDIELPLDSHSPFVTTKKNGGVELIHSCEESWNPNPESGNNKEVFRNLDFHFDMLALSNDDDPKKPLNENITHDDEHSVASAASLKGRIGDKYKKSVQKGKRLFRRTPFIKKTESLGEQVDIDNLTLENM